MNLKTKTYTTLADTLTPVSIYLKLRDLYPKSILLESNLNEKRDKSRSYICLNPIASFRAFKTQISLIKNGQPTQLNSSGADAPKLFYPLSM